MASGGSSAIKNFEDYQKVYAESIKNPVKFWEKVASDFQWKTPWQTPFSWDSASCVARWFDGATFNITENIFERHLPALAEKKAMTWVGNEPTDQERSFTFGELFSEVCRAANFLASYGVKKGDRVIIYLPLIPEALISMLACARLGAIHSVVFAGFSAEALRQRIIDSGAKIVITADSSYRGAKLIPIKDIVDEAVSKCPSLEHVIIVPHADSNLKPKDQREIIWDLSACSAECPAVAVESEDPLFILYTSGSTGKPKGVVHAAGGYMVYTSYTFDQVFQCADDSVFWCTADVGWITGHSYVAYGPLLSGASILMYEGSVVHPTPSRPWEIIDQHKVTHFYTAPTAIRLLRSHGDEFVDPYTLDSLKVLGSVGEPIDEESWRWLAAVVGKDQCPIVDTWWQTETGGILISPLAGITDTKPGYATLPLPGIVPALLDEDGREILDDPDADRVQGNLVIKHPWPSMIRDTFGESERFKRTYFGRFPGIYFTGDGAYRDKQGYYRILGRVDDVVNVSGHRLGTAEVENAISSHELVREVAVIGVAHAIKGQAIVAFVVCEEHGAGHDMLREIQSTVVSHIGAIARPESIFIVDALPKTRSGKLMRRILRRIVEGELQEIGDVSTLLNPECLQHIQLIVEGSAANKMCA